MPTPQNSNSVDDTPITPSLHHITDVSYARSLLESKAVDPNECDNTGKTPLFYASSLAMVLLLLEYNADCYHLDNIGQNILYNSTGQLSIEIIEYLLKHKNLSPLISDIHGRSPLHIVNIPQLISLYIEYNADPNICDPDGYTPLHITNNESIVNILLSHNADPNKQSRYGYFPLCRSCDNPQSTQLLLHAKADPNIYHRNDLAPIHMSKSYGVTKSLLDSNANPYLLTIKDKQTALHLSLDENITSVLLHTSIDPNICDKNGIPPLLNAFNDNMVHLLLQYNADPNICDQYGCHILTDYDKPYLSYNTIQYMITCKLDVNITNNDGDGILHKYYNYKSNNTNNNNNNDNNIDIIMLLIYNNININIKNKHNRTVLHLSYIDNNINIFRILLQYINTNTINIYNNIIDIPMSGPLPIYTYNLLSYKLDPNIHDNDYNTPLYTSNDIYSIYTLLYYNADPNYCCTTTTTSHTDNVNKISFIGSIMDNQTYYLYGSAMKPSLLSEYNELLCINSSNHDNYTPTTNTNTINTNTHHNTIVTKRKRSKHTYKYRQYTTIPSTTNDIFTLHHLYTPPSLSTSHFLSCQHAPISDPSHVKCGNTIDGDNSTLTSSTTPTNNSYVYYYYADDQYYDDDNDDDNDNDSYKNDDYFYANMHHQDSLSSYQTHSTVSHHQRVNHSPSSLPSTTILTLSESSSSSSSSSTPTTPSSTPTTTPSLQSQLLILYNTYNALPLLLYTLTNCNIILSIPYYNTVFDYILSIDDSSSNTISSSSSSLSNHDTAYKIQSYTRHELITYLVMYGVYTTSLNCNNNNNTNMNTTTSTPTSSTTHRTTSNSHDVDMTLFYDYTRETIQHHPIASLLLDYGII